MGQNLFEIEIEYITKLFIFSVCFFWRFTAAMCELHTHSFLFHTISTSIWFSWRKKVTRAYLHRILYPWPHFSDISLLSCMITHTHLYLLHKISNKHLVLLVEKDKSCVLTQYFIVRDSFFWNLTAILCRLCINAFLFYRISYKISRAYLQSILYS